MPVLTINKSIQYADAVTGTQYTLDASVTIACSVAVREYHSLSSGSSTNVLTNFHAPTSTGDIKYVSIYNSGASSAYIAIVDETGTAMQHEIIAGGVFEVFGQDIMSTDYFAPVYSRLNNIYAKGNTTIEVDIFQ